MVKIEAAEYIVGEQRKKNRLLSATRAMMALIQRQEFGKALTVQGARHGFFVVMFDGECKPGIVCQRQGHNDSTGQRE